MERRTLSRGLPAVAPRLRHLSRLLLERHPLHATRRRHRRGPRRQAGPRRSGQRDLRASGPPTLRERLDVRLGDGVQALCGHVHDRALHEGGALAPRRRRRSSLCLVSLSRDARRRRRRRDRHQQPHIWRQDRDARRLRPRTRRDRFRRRQHRRPPRPQDVVVLRRRPPSRQRRVPLRPVLRGQQHALAWTQVLRLRRRSQAPGARLFAASRDNARLHGVLQAHAPCRLARDIRGARGRRRRQTSRQRRL
mmetsp:Transcript_8263/g.25601  ORF Transcript_8263/g.25601 Transcript_8263/m.25601 type:complete len:250 (-) Transcript_8263:615-1364(-)